MLSCSCFDLGVEHAGLDSDGPSYRVDVNVSHALGRHDDAPVERGRAARQTGPRTARYHCNAAFGGESHGLLDIVGAPRTHHGKGHASVRIVGPVPAIVRHLVRIGDHTALGQRGDESGWVAKTQMSGHLVPF